MNHYRLFLPLIVCYFFSNLLIGQSMVKGKVIQEDHNPIPYANILLFKNSESSLLKGTITDENGDFEIAFNNSVSAMLTIQNIGFEDYRINLAASKEIIDLGEVILKESVETLSEVILIAKKPLFEKKIDRTIVNVQSSVTNAGNTALNVLSKSPSVSINRATNEINLMGKQGVLVMINNKQVRMEPSDLINLLESMPVDNIKNIELITAPPASYDAQGNAGVININMIKSDLEGFTGRISGNIAYGEQMKYGGSVNMTFRKNRLYLYSNLSANVNNETQRISLITDYTYSDERVISDLFSNRNTMTGLYSGEVGVDYNLSNNTVAGLLFNFNNRDWEMDATSDTNIESELFGFSKQFVASIEENKLFRNLLNFNIRHNFSEENSFSVDYDYISFRRNNPSVYNVVNTRDGSLISEEDFLSLSETPLHIHVLKVDWQLGIFDKIKIETGFKTTMSDFKNSVQVAFKEDDDYVDDPDYTDKFTMNEEIYAGYISLDWQLNSSLLLKSGLRYEYYNLELNADNQGSIVDRARGNLFPSMYLNYKPNETNEFNLSYVKRIERPGFQSLAPYFYFFNQNTLFTGNPNLIPANSNQYKLDYRYKNFQFGFEFSNIQRPIYSLQPGLDRDDQLVIVKPGQGLKSNIFSLSANFPWKINDWWSSRYSIIGYLRNLSTVIENKTSERNAGNVAITSNHTFNIGNQWQLEANATYASAYDVGVARVASRYGLDIGLQKKFHNGTVVSLNVSDVFNSSSQWPIRADLSGQGILYDWKYDGEGPVFRINLSIPFGDTNLKKKEKRSSGSEDEQKRLD
ncbi:outer membrane beta-barrel family protein [Abyssalbus ytuae]|uniref:TonB-dependent receptor n=1 Tax=Abyssalbus ytuae TaxID=2926907 RepID=A0A9E7D122_9FLAO|nr:outer membrane beta-barrel family protein [Abyssalbus ytuae]UOB18940.1 TonB-dependent receptor [Abyssalbus ytuae]